METYTCVNLDSVFDGTEVLVDETIPKDSIIGHPTVDIALLFTDRYPGICAPIQADYVPSRSSVLTGISTVSPRFISETDSEKFSNIIRRRHLFEHVISDGRSLDNGFALPILEFPQDEPTSGRLKETIEKFGEAPLDSHFSIYDTTNISTLSSLATVGDSGAPLFDKGNHSIVAIVKGYSYCIAKFPDGGDKGIVENTYITFNKALIEWIDTTIRSRYPAHTTVAYTAAGDAATAAGDAGTAAADGAGASAAGGAGASALGGTGTAAAGGAGASAGASAGTY